MPPDEATYLALRPLIRAVVARTLGAPLFAAEVDEVTQEALAAAWGALVRSPPPESLRSYVAAIAANVARDAIAARRKERLLAPLPEGEEHAPRAPHPIAPLEARDHLRHLALRLTRLPEGQRRAFEGFFMDGKSYETLAAEFAVPVGTIATWIFRAKAALTEDVASAPIAEARRNV